MPCFRPLQAWKTSAGSVVFSERSGADVALTLPCGACLGCRLDRARSWSLRCVHEASLQDDNCFITLTYSPQCIPPGGSLRYRDFQLFMKRLRKRFPGKRIRYFVVGEYGERLSRPHYHACVFGFRFPDERPLTLLGKASGFSSEMLSALWQHGHHHIGMLNRDSAQYAARYCLKKITGRAADEHYSRVDVDGVVHRLEPEFARMSLRPGIGREWFDRFSADVVAVDSVVHDGVKYPVPPYYDRVLGERDPDLLARLKEDRELRAVPQRWNNSPERLAVREEVKRASLRDIRRNLETGLHGDV